MTILLRPPAKPGARGPDGQGWNRLSLNAHTGEAAAQCALQPRTYAALHDSRRDTRLTAWGPYGRCLNGGRCTSCPVLQAAPYELRAFTQNVMVRVFDRVGPMLMEHPDRGSDSTGYGISWADLARLHPGWELSAHFADEVSEGFWLHWTGGVDRGIYGLARLSPGVLASGEAA